MFHARVILPLLAAACVCLPARAQDDSRFREVTPGVEDLGHGEVSTRMRPVDMRVPSDFASVYEILGTDKFARRAGAITAVFDRSLYAGDGTAVIPPGTVFYIGSLPVDLGRPGLFGGDRAWVSAGGAERVQTKVRAAPAGEARVATRVDLRVGVTPPPPPTLADPDETIWTSERYRQRRMGELLRGVAWRMRGLEATRAESAAGRAE